VPERQGSTYRIYKLKENIKLNLQYTLSYFVEVTYQDGSESSLEAAQSPHNKPLKWKFCGNQYSTEKDLASASILAVKLQRTRDAFDVTIDTVNYCFIQFNSVFLSLQELITCIDCSSDVEFVKYGQRERLDFKILVKYLCTETYINSCLIIDNTYEVKRQLTCELVFAMRLFGIDINGIKNFCELMDLEQRIHSNLYYK